MTERWSNLVRQSVAPGLPVSIADMKTHLRESSSGFDFEISAMIDAARQIIEGPDGAGIALTEQQYKLFLPMFPAEVEIPLHPVRTIDSIDYTDVDGNPATVDPATYETSIVQGAKVRPKQNESWPSTDTVYDAVQVTFTCGYEIIPEDLLQAIKLIVSHWYDNRSETAMSARVSQIPFGAESIINRYRRGFYA